MAVLLANQKPDAATGRLSLNLAALGANQTFVRVVAFDEEHCAIRGVPLSNAHIDDSVREYECAQFERFYSDNRLMPGLDPAQLYVDRRSVVMLPRAGDEYVIDDFKTAQIETYHAAFFERVCVPLIASKMSKDLIDYFLLGDRAQLRTYCSLERLQALNPLEQVLLAQAQVLRGEAGQLGRRSRGV